MTKDEATKARKDVTLPHDMADRVVRILADYAASQLQLARRTKSAAVRYQCETDGLAAKDLVEQITRDLWSWS